ncbi:GNAT family N-acetyltransferase, partial [Vibrio parahaemolyticus]
DALPAMIAPALNGEAPDLWIMAERDGAAAGFAFAEPEKFTDRTWNLRAIGTDPAWRACGVGSTLLAAVEAQLAGIGARLLIIE